jgi:hypothetical protein
MGRVYVPVPELAVVWNADGERCLVMRDAPLAKVSAILLDGVELGVPEPDAPAIVPDPTEAN